MTRQVAIQDALNLWARYVAAREALLASGVVRSNKSAESDFAEWLVARCVGGELATSKSNPAFDVHAGQKRIQVKSLAKAPGNPNGYILTPKDRENDPSVGANHYAFVFFEGLVPNAVFLAPAELVRDWPRSQIKRPDLEGHPSVERLWHAGMGTGDSGRS